MKAGPALDTEPTGAVNDLVERLPGDYSRGPSPLWSGLAGLALALTLVALWLIVVAGGQTRRPSREPEQSQASYSGTTSL